jgi:hypothetical protein
VSATGALTVLSDRVSFLRWRIGEPAADELVPGDPDALAVVVAECGRGRGTEDPAVAASLWWQSYAYRVAGTALAAWAVAGEGPDATGAAVAHARHRPSAVTYRTDRGISDLDELVATTLEAIEPAADALRARHRVGATLLRGNTMSSIASVLGAIGGSPAVLAALPAELRRTFDDTCNRRRACCLWWKTDESAGRLCADCSLDRVPG